MRLSTKRQCLLFFKFSFVNFLVDLGSNSAIIDRKHLLDFSSRTSAPFLTRFNLTDFPAKKFFLIVQYDYKDHKVFIS